MVNSEKAKNIIVLHHSIQSLNNKIQELSLYLHVSETMVDVLCFTEHWLSGDQIKLINLDQYKLRSQFCMEKKKGWRFLYIRQGRVQNKTNSLFE
jgi:hypothetical protein